MVQSPTAVSPTGDAMNLGLTTYTGKDEAVAVLAAITVVKGELERRVAELTAARDAAAAELACVNTEYQAKLWAHGPGRCAEESHGVQKTD